MKKLFLILLIFLQVQVCFSQVYEEEWEDSVMFPLENKKTLFCVYTENDVPISLYENIEDIVEKFGEPIHIEETKNPFASSEDYNRVTYIYSDFEVMHWKKSPRILYIKVKSDKCYVSEKKAQIGKSTIAEVLELNQELDLRDYYVWDSEDGKKNLDVSFKTTNHDFMPEKALKNDWCCAIFYSFDYNKKICTGIQLTDVIER